jgi:hypothetical protein
MNSSIHTAKPSVGRIRSGIAISTLRWGWNDGFLLRCMSLFVARSCGASSFRDLPQLGESGGAIGAVVSSAHDPKLTFLQI